MRKVPFPHPMTDEEAEIFYNGPNSDLIIVETNHADEACEDINKKLKKFGLELVEYEAGSSDLYIGLRKLGE